MRYEARGHGRSGYPEEPAAYESARYADDFKTVCDAFGVVKPFVLGWCVPPFFWLSYSHVNSLPSPLCHQESWWYDTIVLTAPCWMRLTNRCAYSYAGGIIVDIIEAFGANFISGAIYCGGAVLTRELHTTYMQPMLEKLVPDLLSTDSNVISRASLQFVQSCVENPHAALPFETKIQWLGGCAMLPQNVRLLTLSRQQSTDRWEKEIKQLPVLIVHGTMDSMVITSKLQETASRYLQNYQIKLLDDVGHAPFYERPAETNYHILDFVSGRK